MRISRIALAPLAACLMVIAASANAQVYTIDVGNSAISPYSPPYATATINLVDATHANVTFASLSHDGYVFLMGSSQGVDVNVNASSFSVSNLTWANVYSGFTDPGAGTYSVTSGNVSTFGVFNTVIDFFDGFKNTASTFSFSLTNTGGTWASAASVLTPNASGNSAAIHGYVCADPTCTMQAGAVATGYASDGVTPPIPEPETYAMLLAGLTLLGFTALRRRKPDLGVRFIALPQ